MAASQALQFPTSLDRPSPAAGHDYVTCQLDRAGRIISRSPGASDTDGFADDEVIGRHVRVFYTRDDVARCRPEKDLDAAAAAELYEDAGWRVRKNGSRYWADVLITPTHDNGRLLGFSFVMRELQYRRPAERLPASFRKLAETLIDTVRSPLLLLDASLRVTRASQSFYAAFAMTPEDTIGASLLELADGAWDIPELRLLRGGGAGVARRRRVEELRVERDIPTVGSRMLVLNGRHIALGDDRSELVLLAMEDVTEEHATSPGVGPHGRAHSRSHADLEQFAAVVRHDLHDRLRGIEAVGDRLRATCGHLLPLEAQDELAGIVASASRMQALADDLLAFSQVAAREAPFEPVDLGAVLRHLVVDIQPWLDTVGGIVDIGALPTIEADPLQMHQLLQNLIDNALKFHRANLAPIVVVRGGIIDGRCRLTVSDNGIGVDPMHAERIFTLFERIPTVRPCDGTGVGLAICRTIVEHHGGTIAVEASPSRGAQFVVHLPITHRAVDDDRAEG